MSAALRIAPNVDTVGKHQCGNCRFFVGKGHRSPGDCRYDPPVVLVMPDSAYGYVTRWPEVLPTESGCARWVEEA